MDCLGNRFEWLNCNDTISGTIFCILLPESIFDIKVKDDQDIPQTDPSLFGGSPTGKIIQNLEPGTYTVEEIKHPTSDENQLREDSTAEQECIIAGFPHGGGFLRNSASGTNYYFICLEYEDEQGDDCNTITLAAGESRTCTVKNYILFASIF